MSDHVKGMAQVLLLFLIAVVGLFGAQIIVDLATKTAEFANDICLNESSPIIGIFPILYYIGVLGVLALGIFSAVAFAQNPGARGSMATIFTVIVLIVSGAVLFFATPSQVAEASSTACLLRNGTLTMDAPIKQVEAAAPGSDTAGYGQWWVKNEAPAAAFFTDDVGTDNRIAYGFGMVSQEVELVIPITGASTPGGVGSAKAELLAIGGAGSVLEEVLSFDKVVQENIYFTVHSPEDLDDAINVEFHLMWLPDPAWTAGNYMWKLEYICIDEDDNSQAGAPTTIQASVTPANATDFIETEYTTTIDLNTEEVLIGHFYRDIANDNGDDDGLVRFFEIEYTRQ